MFKKSLVFNKKMNFPKFEYQRFAFFSLFLCGLIIGSITVAKGENQFSETCKTLLESYLGVKSQSGFLRDFADLLFIFVLIPLFSYLCGLCAVGIPFIFMGAVLFGLGAGFYITLIMKSYEASGVAFAALSVIPGTALAVVCLTKCCVYASKMSLNVFALLRAGKNQTENALLITEYTKNYFLYLIPAILGALTNACTFALFKSLFTFV